jgi:hypothetical protein
MELFRNYLKQQGFYPKEEKKERKDETLFEVDTFITMCMNVIYLLPLDYLEDYIDLVTSIEITGKLQMPS